MEEGFLRGPVKTSDWPTTGEASLQCYYWENGWLLAPLKPDQCIPSWGAVGSPTSWWRLNNANRHPSHPRHHPQLTTKGTLSQSICIGHWQCLSWDLEASELTLSPVRYWPRKMSAYQWENLGFSYREKEFLANDFFLLHVFNTNGKIFLQKTQTSPADEGSLYS